MQLPTGSCIPLRSWSRIRNHGDRISADIIRLLFGAEPVEVAPDQPHLLAVGSITFMANRFSTLWGSGVLNRQVGLQELGPGQIRALRGRHSAEMMGARGIRVPDVPLGDPGIFAADLLRLEGLAPRRRSRIVVVPHHGSLRHPAFAAMAEREDVTVVDTLDNDWGLLQDIAGADIVVSESLRGLIYAESFAKPSVWISNTEDPNWTFKFNDWFSTTFNPQHRPAPLATNIDELARQAEWRFSRIDKAELLQAFPHERAAAVPPLFVPYRQCRAMSPMTVYGDDTLTAALQVLSSRGAGAPAAWERIRARLAQIFGVWAERPYVCVVDRGHAAIPTEQQARIIAAELDRSVAVDFAVIADRRHLAQAGGEGVVLGERVTLHPDARPSGGAMVLRPSLDAYGDNYAVFGI